MLEPSSPENEIERLRALLEYKVLDTEPEVGFNAITKLASQICRKPIALISLIDQDRQWFLSRVGLDATETPRNVSFCGHAIHGQDLFEIEDSTKDSRFSDNPLVIGAPEVIFYAGMPLTNPEGHNLGTLCVIDNNPGKLTHDQVQSLKLLAQQVVSLLEYRKQNLSLKKANSQIRNMAVELDNLRVQTFETRRLASLGTLTGGVAHEINNPLSVIQILAARLRIQASSSSIKTETVLEDSEKILSTVERIANIVTSMKNIYRKGSASERSATSMESIYNDALNIMATQLKRGGVAMKTLGDLKVEAICNSSEISQVVMNLISNSIHATKDLEQRWIEFEVSADENRVTLAITDSGPGIPNDIKDQIFDPFFTTKPTGEGTGMGLSLCRSIAERNQGTLEVGDKNGNTQFKISLERAAASRDRKTA